LLLRPQNIFLSGPTKGFEISRAHSGDDEQSSLLELVNSYRRFGKAQRLYLQNSVVQYCLTVMMVPVLDFEEGSSTILRNFGNHLPVDKCKIAEHFHIQLKGSLCGTSGSTVGKYSYCGFLASE
jgi:hypothetical protein